MYCWILKSISISRLFGWKNEIIHSIKNNHELSEVSSCFMKNPTYGDGGMASAVHIASIDKELSVSLYKKFVYVKIYLLNC